MSKFKSVLLATVCGADVSCQEMESVIYIHFDVAGNCDVHHGGRQQQTQYRA